MNGCGERTGNANLVSIIANLQLKLGFECLSAEQLARLTETAHFVDEILNVTPDPNQPYVGRNAFAHKGGMHVAGVSADAATFEHIEPALVGNERELLVSELAGRASVLEKAAALGIDLEDGAAGRILERIKELEHRGYQFEAAEGSLELLLRRESGGYEPLFTLESWRVIVEQRADGEVQTEATVKIWLDGERRVTTAEGNGPVNALDARFAPRSARSTRTSPTSSSSTSRSASSTRTRAPARSLASCSTPPTGARCGDRSACRRTSSPPPGRRSSTPSSAACCRAASVSDPRSPAGPAGSRPGRGAGRARRAAERTTFAGAASRALRGALRLTDRVPARLRRVKRHHRACISPCARSASATATRSSRAPSRSSPRPTRSSTNGPARSSSTSIRAR